MEDSDDDFSTKVQIEESIPKKSKLSKKKNKENVKKPHTSTQKEVPEPITGKYPVTYETVLIMSF